MIVSSSDGQSLSKLILRTASYQCSQVEKKFYYYDLVQVQSPRGTQLGEKEHSFSKVRLINYCR